VNFTLATITDADTDSTNLSAANLGLAAAINGAAGAAAGATAGAVKTVDALVTEINANTSLKGKVTASNDGGKLRIQNLSTTDLTVGGASGPRARSMARRARTRSMATMCARIWSSSSMS
jgi:hypothetical protein